MKFSKSLVEMLFSFVVANAQRLTLKSVPRYARTAVCFTFSWQYGEAHAICRDIVMNVALLELYNRPLACFNQE